MITKQKTVVLLLIKARYFWGKPGKSLQHKGNELNFAKPWFTWYDFAEIRNDCVVCSYSKYTAITLTTRGCYAVTPSKICLLGTQASRTASKETMSETMLSLDNAQLSMEDNLHKIAIKKEITKAAISHSGPKLWNNIPRSVREAPSLDLFKKEFRELLAGLNEHTFLFGFFSVFK